MSKGNQDTPFFLVGCVRSGTTLLCNLLRLHPHLECPEETHIFRWALPFGSHQYLNHFRRPEIMKHHKRSVWRPICVGRSPTAPKNDLISKIMTLRLNQMLCLFLVKLIAGLFMAVRQ